MASTILAILDHRSTLERIKVVIRAVILQKVKMQVSRAASQQQTP